MAFRTFTLDRVDDIAGLMTKERGRREAMVYGVEDFDGAFAEQGGSFHAARTVTITLAPGPWNGKEPVVIEGFFGNGNGVPKPEREELALPARVQGQPFTVRGTLPFMFPPGVTITVPAQPSAARSFTIGVGDVVAPAGEGFEDVRATADGVLAVRYSGAHDDALELARGERLGIRVAAVIAEQTEHGVTLYMGMPRSTVEHAVELEPDTDRNVPRTEETNDDSRRL